MFWLLCTIFLAIFVSWGIARLFVIKKQSNDKQHKILLSAPEPLLLGPNLDYARARGNIKIPQGLCIDTHELEAREAEENRKGWATC